jgi:peptide/nickel transport system substrate-binding protein
VFFSSDVANPDTYPHFYCDIQMYTIGSSQPDPFVFLNQFVSWEVATKENKWQGRNITRWVNKEADEAYRAAEGELDPVKRAALFIRLNDLPVKDGFIIPLISRPRVRGANLKLVTALTGWDLDFSVLQNWYREA